jgi:GTP diphosphokinase / guanosine-3',5'-bis(diphosphate) 3'-diphosphatase
MFSSTSPDESDASVLLRAAHYSARRHRAQRRKGSDADPYINHPLHVASLLAEHGAITAVDILVAALLHDTVEDTETTDADLRDAFGNTVADLVAEVTDDRSLSKDERKEAQVAHAPSLSRGAKLIKLADKTSNVRDMYANPPQWPLQRRMEYLDWAMLVVSGIRGVHVELEALFDETMGKAWAVLRAEESQRKA